MRKISGATQVVGVVGDPIAHSLSPTIHNAAFEHLGLDWTCLAFSSSADQAINAVNGVRALGIRGMSVTMPLKGAVIPALDEITDDASRLGAVNCIVSKDGRLSGHSTDGDGFVAGLSADHGFSPDGRRCVVLGAGGAARSVVLALSRAGAAKVAVVNRTQPRAEQAARLAGDIGIVGTDSDIGEADLIVNATPVGMDGVSTGPDLVPPALPCGAGLLRPGQVVVDLIYHPFETEFMHAAVRAGAQTSNGVSMLVHQAALAFELWTGNPAPIDAMTSAALTKISGSKPDNSGR